jgi:hypothetical protein
MTAEPSCPTLVGQDCRGRLTPGSYTTRALTPALTYTVPGDGWSNRQDRPGNFILLAPGFNPAGINESTSEYIGVFTAVVLDSNCAEAHPPGVSTPAAMTRWLQHRPGLVLSNVGPASVGGLRGTVQDVEMAHDWQHSCYGWPYPAVPLISGQKPSLLVHMMTANWVMRLYLLRSTYFGRPVVLAVEAVDVAPYGALASYSQIIQSFRFGRPL